MDVVFFSILILSDWSHLGRSRYKKFVNVKGRRDDDVDRLALATSFQACCPDVSATEDKPNFEKNQQRRVFTTIISSFFGPLKDISPWVFTARNSGYYKCFLVS